MLRYGLHDRRISCKGTQEYPCGGFCKEHIAKRPGPKLSFRPGLFRCLGCATTPSEGKPRTLRQRDARLPFFL